MLDILKKAKVGEIYIINRDDAEGLVAQFKNGEQVRIPNGEIITLLDIIHIIDHENFDNEKVKLILLYNNMICYRETRLWFDEIFREVEYDI